MEPTRPTGPTGQEQPQEQGGLQFDRAEYAEGGDPESFECAFCGAPLRSSYFQLNEKASCEACRYREEQEFQIRPGVPGFLKSLAAGFLAAAVGAGIYYAVLALTGYEVGLISILVGFMVGSAVRWGAKGKGGWAYQTLAIFLTYMAIVSTYIPLMFQELDKEQAAGTEREEPVQQAAAGSPASDPVALTATADGKAAVEEEEVTAGQFFLAVGAVLAVAAALPFLAGFENVLGLLIIGFGLWQAWKLNKRATLEISGPFQVGKVPEPSPAPAG